MLEVVAAFVVGCLAGSAATWLLLSRRSSASAPRSAPMQVPNEPEDEPEPVAAGVSEVGQLASASRQLLSELETRYQGRTVNEGEPRSTKRRPKAPRPKRR